jgi:hypothetical protein
MRTIQFLLLVASSLALAFGETIELKTGERIEGAFKQATSAGAVIEVAGQPITIPLEKIKAIYFVSASSAPIAALAPAQEAIEALKALRSVTNSGLAYRDYAPRVLDTRIKVDHYLSLRTKEPAQNPVGLAMRYYELALEAWEKGVLAVDVGKVIVGDSSLSACGTLKAAAPLIPTRTPLPAEEKLKSPVLVGTYVGQHPSTLWGCADERIEEAERLIGQR